MVQRPSLSTSHLRRTNRQRGEHSTRCKCPHPAYFRSRSFKNLPGELGRAYHNLVGYDADGRPFLKRHVSRDIFFVQYRHLSNRRRDFRPERRRLIDALWPLLISKLDLATGLVTICLTTVARELSVMDCQGNIDASQAVSPSRISRLIKELVRYGLLEAQSLEWDAKRNMFMPRYIALTEQGWKLTHCNIDKLLREQQQRLRETAPQNNEFITVNEARKTWLEKKRLSTLIKRNNAISADRRAILLAHKTLEERQHAVASWLRKKLGVQHCVSLKEGFIKLVWQELRRMGLAGASPPK